MSDAVIFQISGDCNCTSVTRNIHRFLNRQRVSFTHSFGIGEMPIEYIFFPIPENINKKEFEKELKEYAKENNCHYDIFYYPGSTKEKVTSIFRKNKGIVEQVSNMIGKDTLTEILQMLLKASMKTHGY